MSKKFIEKNVEIHFDDFGEKYTNLRNRVYDPIYNFINNTKNTTFHNNILEVGCGGGAFLIKMQKDSSPFSNYVGIDISSSLLKNIINRENIHPLKADALFLPLRNSRFNYIIAASLLHHLIGITPRLSADKYLRSLFEFVRVSQRTGYLLIYEEPVITSKNISLITYWITRVMSFLTNRTPIVNFLTILDVENIIKEVKKINSITLISKTESLYKERTGGYFLEKLYYKIFSITYDVFIILKKNV